jgi:hypothetical protein
MEWWDELRFIHGMEAIVSLWDRTELITFSASNEHVTVDATFDVQSKEVFLQTQEDSPAEEWDATAAIKRWAEGHSFSFTTIVEQ